MKQPLYRERDFAFGEAMLRLRSELGLTQTALAEHLTVSRRAIGDWETGNSYPKPEHLKNFIALLIDHKVFKSGQETEEIRALWKAAHIKALLDEFWLEQLLLIKEPTKLPNQVASHISSNQVSAPLKLTQKRESKVDWDDALSVPTFYGREEELKELTSWVVNGNYRVVGVLGLGGIGKSALVVKLMHDVVPHFDVVIWRSLRDAPHFDDLLDSCLQILVATTFSAGIDSTERRLSMLLKHLQSRRILLVLDNLESVLEEDQNTGYLRKGYESYGKLLERVAETVHPSCLLFTSREKPKNLLSLEGQHLPFQTLRLNWLDTDACEQLLIEKDIKGTYEQRKKLSKVFAGNPLALKIVAQTILDLFGGEIGSFLEQGELIFGGVRQLLEQQFIQLSTLEQTVLLWLAIKREPTMLNELQADWNKPIARLLLLEAIDSLYRRSLIERGEKPGSFTLQSVILEYASMRFVEKVYEEIKHESLKRLVEHALTLAQAKDYVRQSQERLIVEPLLNRLKGELGAETTIVTTLVGLLNAQRLKEKTAQGYAPTNLLTLLRFVRGDLHGLNLSNLILRGAYLQGVPMQDTNLAAATIQDSVFTETFGSIAAIAISRDGHYWATLNLNWELLVWQVEANHVLRLLWQTETEEAIRLSISPDSRTLAVGGRVFGIKLWDLATGKFLKSLAAQGEAYQIHEVVFSPDSKKLATAGFDSIVHIWDLDTAKELETIPHQERVPVLAWSPNGRLLATGDVRGTIRLWEITSQKPALCIQTLQGHTQGIVSLSFAPDGESLASGSWDGTVKLWRVDSKESYKTLSGHKARVSRVAWSPDGGTIASGGRDNDPTIRLWNVAQESYRAVLSGHSGTIRGLAFTQDSSNLVSGGEDGTLRVWDVKSGQVIRVLQSYRANPLSIDWSPDGKRLVNSSTDYSITVYNVSGVNPPRTLPATNNYASTVRWSPDGKWIVSNARNNVIRLWSGRTGEFLKLLEKPKDEAYSENGLEWSHDGRWLASGTNKYGLIMWNMLDYSLRWNERFFPDKINGISWHPDGTKVAGGGDKGTLYIWDSKSGEVLQQLTAEHYTQVKKVIWSPNGNLIACTTNGQTEYKIAIWDTLENKASISLGQQLETVQSICWSANEEVLISGDTSGKLKWWNVATGECLLVKQAHKERVTSLRRSPDGTKLASCGSDSDVKLWDINTGEYLQTLRRDRPYERMNITGIKGLSEAQRATLMILGAVEE